MDIRDVDKLEESEKLAEAILSTAVDGIITIDEAGTVLSFNSAAEKIFGYKKDEIIGKTVNILMPEPYRSEHDGYLRNYITTGKRKIIGIGREVVGKKKDGTVFPMELAVSEVKTGKRRIFAGLARDITERKNAERLIKESEEKFSKAFNIAPILQTISSLDDGRYMEVNDAFQRKFRIRRKDVIEKSADELGFWVDPEGRDKIVKMIKRQGFVRNIEVKFKDPAGNIFVGLLSADVIELNGKQCLLTEAIDITELKAAERVLRESEGKFRTLVEDSLAGVYFFQNGSFVYTNPTFARIFGYSDNEIEALPDLMELVHPADRDMVRDANERRICGEIPSMYYQFRGMTKDKETIHLEALGSCTSYKGGPAIVGTVLDITQRTLLEQQKADLDLYLSGLPGNRRTILETWIRLQPYRSLVPAAAREVERQLYMTDLETILELLKNEYGVVSPDPDA
ncbi:MAG: PAS domain S-box protein [Nitrospirota bacterium]